MELGEKIRCARLEKGLSQRQLCGDVITRNMLSQIENGSARPSMDTLRYFAGRLEKSVSYFLEEDAVVSPNRALMETARSLFSAGEFSRVTDCLRDYREPDPVFDPERFLLQALSLMELARLSAEEKPVYAEKLLEQAARAGEATPYFTDAERRYWVLLMSRVRPDRAEALVAMLPEDEGEMLLRGQAALSGQRYEESLRYLEAVSCRDPRWQLLRGRVAMGQRNFAEAKGYFHAAEEAFPIPAAQALEICYRELEDYKMAYFYACKQR